MTEAAYLIPWHAGRFLPGDATLDETHAAFAVLVNRLAQAADAEFAAPDSALAAHLMGHVGG